MKKMFKILMLGICLLAGVSLAFAAYDSTAYFRKNVTFGSSNSTSLGVAVTSTPDASYYLIDSDKLYAEVWEAVYQDPVSGFWYCYCCAPDTTISVTSTAVSGGMPADSLTLTLKDYVYSANGSGSEAAPNKFINASPGVPLILGTSTTPSNSTALELEDGQTLNLSHTGQGWSGGCLVDLASDTAYAYVADDAVTTADIVVRTENANYGLGDSSEFTSGNSIYIQVTDTDEDRKGYSQEIISVTVSSDTLGDSESVTLTETDTTGGVFRYTTGLLLQDATSASAGNGTLEISPLGDTLKVRYQDANVQTAAGHTADDVTDSFTLGTLLTGFSVSADSSTQVAGSPFNLTITALKSGGTLDTYTGSVTLSRTFVSPTSGSEDISYTSPITFSSSDSGVKTVSITYSDCGTITITATDSDDTSMTGTSSDITFYPYDFSLSASSLDTAATSSAYARHTVNKPFTLGVTARDASGDTTPNYTGTANLSINYTSPSSSQSGSLGVSSLTSGYWSSGVATLTSQTYNKWGTIRITATDSSRSSTTGTSAYLIFLPKDFSISLSSPKPSRTYFYPNEEFSATVTARDYNNSTLTNYQGTVSLSGSGLSLPANYTFTTSDAGIHQFTGIYGTADASANISAKDATYTSITSESEDVTVKSGTLKVVSTASPVGKVKVSLKLVDSSGNILTEDDSTTFKVSLTEAQPDNSASSDATTTAVTFTDGTASIYVTDHEAEKVTVTPTSVSQDLSVESGTVTFGTLAGRGLGIPLWREIKEPTEEAER